MYFSFFTQTLKVQYYTNGVQPHINHETTLEICERVTWTETTNNMGKEKQGRATDGKEQRMEGKTKAREERKAIN